MSSLWPWVAVAATGALHGANPATGWAFAAWRTRSGTPVLRALVPIGVGHLASVALVAAAVPAALQLGLAFDPLLPQGIAAALLVVVAVHHLRARGDRAGCAPWARTGLALWSFIVGTAHGAGWMLVPALASLCGGDMPAREITASGSLWLALAAVGVHMLAMLAAMGAVAAGVRLGLRAAWERQSRSGAPSGK
jgi:hypothetical protein